MDLDRVYGGVPRFRPEAPWSRRLALRMLRLVPARTENTAFGRVPTVADARGTAEIVFVCADPEALVPEGTQRRLVETLAARPFDLALPVSNESPDPALRCAPAVAYVTPGDLSEVAELMAAGEPVIEPVGHSDFPVFSVRRALLSQLPPGLPLAEVPGAAGGAIRRAVHRGAFVHRYGDLDASERPDLASRVPAGARRALDVGCSRGALAARLRERGVTEIFGIEPDAENARAAAQRYDHVVCARLDGVDGTDWKERFDAVIFGDVLEHLEDPGLALEKVLPWLSPRGRVIASVPNVGHAAVVADLLEGRFDYIPYSILSGTHVRFFTRRSLSDLFESCGYVLEEVSGTETPPTPRVQAWQERLEALRGNSEALLRNLDLTVSEFIVVARASRGVGE